MRWILTEHSLRTFSPSEDIIQSSRRLRSITKPLRYGGTAANSNWLDVLLSPLLWENIHPSTSPHTVANQESQLPGCSPWYGGLNWVKVAVVGRFSHYQHRPAPRCPGARLISPGDIIDPGSLIARHVRARCLWNRGARETCMHAGTASPPPPLTCLCSAKCLLETVFIWLECDGRQCICSHGWIQVARMLLMNVVLSILLPSQLLGTRPGKMSVQQVWLCLFISAVLLLSVSMSYACVSMEQDIEVIVRHHVF